MTRSSGYILSDEGCFGFQHAVCYEQDLWDDLTIEAEGEQCMFCLPNVVPQSRTGSIQDILGYPWPYEMPWRLPEIDRLDRHGLVHIPDQEPLIDCVLWIPYRLLEIVKVQVEFQDVDVTAGLVSVSIQAIAMSEEGDYCQEFEVWLSCEYRGELMEDDC